MAEPHRPTAEPFPSRTSGLVGSPASVDASRLDDRARELEAIQQLGRRAAEAVSVDDLFDRTARLLQTRLPLELIAIPHETGTRPEIRAYGARPLSSAFRVGLTRHLSRLLQWELGRTVAWSFVPTDLPDPATGLQKDFDESTLIVVPVVRHGRPCAYLAVKPERGAEESDLRLLYNAGNQLAVHIDRILATREAEADRFRDILGSMPQAVWLADRDLNIHQSNFAADELMASIPGATCLADLLERLDLSLWLDRARVQLKTTQVAEAALDGERVLNVSVSPFAADETSHGLVVVMTDVSAQRRLQQQLAQSDKMSSLGQMISGIAHELNNPLATILGSAQLLRAWSDDDRLGKRVRVLQEETERCRRIVQNLLSFARKHDPEIKSYSLNELLQSTLALMSYPLRIAGITVKKEMDPAISALAGDPHQIRQVAVNLCNNARQAMEGRSGSVLVVRTQPLAGGGVRWEVADNGPGIPAELRRKIFDPFFTTKKEGEGTGLGLSIVYGIVEAHGGSIEVLPGVESGAIFRIDLPLKKVPDTDVPTTTPVRSAREAPRARVLVLDDEPAFARLLADALSEAGHQATSQLDGAAALRDLERTEFDLILMDLRIPGMIASEWIDRALDRWPQYRGRILVTTGETASDATAEIERRLETQILHKPFDLDTLLARIDERMLQE